MSYFADQALAQTVADNLKQIRTSNNLTQIEMARLLGVSQSSYSYNEHGKFFTWARVAMLSRRLGVDLRSAGATTTITRSPCSHHVLLVGNSHCPVCAMLSRRHAEGWF